MSALAHSPRHAFREEVRRPEAEIDLARVALLVAREEYPHLPVEVYRARLDQLAEEVRGGLGQESAPLLVLQELTRVLFHQHGFRGNRSDYHDPRNSFLNDVLDRRTGIPLTLGIVALEVGWRLELPLEGVSFPHHFLVRFRGEQTNLLVDAFDGGAVLFEDQAQILLDRVYGGMVRMRPAFLAPATRRDMVVRLLTNLKGVYLNAGDDRRALAAVERLLVARPDAASEHRTLGLLLARMGRMGEAARHLRDYLGSDPSPKDSERIRALLRRVERMDRENPGGGQDRNPSDVEHDA
ncbi:MAG: transglutaminase-like domain-containing protein [Longimicrobiales bacterium]|nr:transglutaminase-like domain-containing protein [Longimicrobiales bacterium]